MTAETSTAGTVGPRSWALNDWYIQNSLWRTSEPDTGRATIAPETAEAYSGHHWLVTYEVGDRPLEAGSHIAIEIPAGWTPHLGRPLHGGRQMLVPAESLNPGYAAWARADADGGARFQLAVSDCTRFQVLDVLLVEGSVPAGGRVRLWLGTEDGSRLRCPWFAQVSPLAMGVDREGKGAYRPVLPPPAVTVVGARAAGLRAIVPATVEPGEEFAVTLQAVDQYGANLASQYRGEVEVVLPDNIEMNGAGRPLGLGANSTTEMRVWAGGSGPALIRAFDRERALAGRSNPVGIGFCDTGERIVFGDLHGQAYASIGTGTMDEYHTWAREVEQLDFCAPANHYGGRMDFDNLPGWDRERAEALEALWAEDVDAANRHYDPGRFVALVAFECAVGGYGHKNVYYRGDTGSYIRGQDGLTPDDLWAQLEAQGLPAITIPHHPKFCGPTDWSFHNDRYQRLVEICSGWGISEEGGPNSVRAALALGHRIGFVGGTDTHFGQPGRSPHFFGEGNGITGVYVSDLTREALWDALYARRCYATTGARILLRVEVNGSLMGGEIDGAGAEVAAHVIGTDPDYEVDVIRNGEVVYGETSNSYEHRLAWADPGPKGGRGSNADPVSYYYVRVRQADRHQAWSSPVWLHVSGK